MLPTTPTMVFHGNNGPSLMRRPTGSASGQYLAAIAWLMITTGGDPIVSKEVNSRPFTNGMRMVRKKAGSTSHDKTGPKKSRGGASTMPGAGGGGRGTRQPSGIASGGPLTWIGPSSSSLRIPSPPTKNGTL